MPTPPTNSMDNMINDDPSKKPLSTSKINPTNTPNSTDDSSKKALVYDEEEFKAALKKQEEEQKKREEEAKIANQEDANTARKHMGNLWGLPMKAWYFVEDILKMAKSVPHAVEFIGKYIIPPVGAVVRIASGTLDMVEGLFFSQETLNRRAVKVTNGFVSMGLGIAALALGFANPPLGLALLTGAMFFSSAKDFFFWRKAEKDLRRAERAIKGKQLELDLAIRDILENKHKADIERIHTINSELQEIEIQITQPKLSTIDNLPNLEKKQNELRNKKSELVNKIDYDVNHDKTVEGYRDEINKLREKYIECRATRDEKKKAFYTSAIQTVAMVIATLCVAALVTNPFFWGAVAFSLFTATAVVAISDKVMEKRKAAEKEARIARLNSADSRRTLTPTEAKERLIHENEKSLQCSGESIKIKSYRHEEHPADTYKIILQMSGEKNKKPRALEKLLLSTQSKFKRQATKPKESFEKPIRRLKIDKHAVPPQAFYDPDEKQQTPASAEVERKESKSDAAPSPPEPNSPRGDSPKNQH